jgi:hypothetical protein
VAVGTDRTDAGGAPDNASPRGTLPIMRFASGWQQFWRLMLVLFVTVGLIEIVIGIVTLDRARLLGSVVSTLFWGTLLAISSGGSESVSSVRGPEGGFVIRTSNRPTWRAARGLLRIRAFLTGERERTVVVRTEASDPFGTPLFVGARGGPREAVDLAREVEQHIRRGDESLETLSLAEENRRAVAGAEPREQIRERRVTVIAAWVVSGFFVSATISALLQRTWGAAAIFGAPSVLAVVLVVAAMRTRRAARR